MLGLTACIAPEELAAIRERCAKTTPGPWGVGDPDSNMLPHSSNNEVVAKSFLVVSRNVYGKDSDNQTYANIVFIAHARTDIPRLLDALEALNAENFSLAAWQCIHLDGSGLTGGERGNNICLKTNALEATNSLIARYEAERAGGWAKRAIAEQKRADVAEERASISDKAVDTALRGGVEAVSRMNVALERAEKAEARAEKAERKLAWVLTKLEGNVCPGVGTMQPEYGPCNCAGKCVACWNNAAERETLR